MAMAVFVVLVAGLGCVTSSENQIEDDSLLGGRIYVADGVITLDATAHGAPSAGFRTVIGDGVSFDVEISEVGQDAPELWVMAGESGLVAHQRVLASVVHRDGDAPVTCWHAGRNHIEVATSGGLLSMSCNGVDVQIPGDEDVLRVHLATIATSHATARVTNLRSL